MGKPKKEYKEYGIIYCAINNTDKKMYIGQTTCPLYVRKHQHFYASKKSKYKFTTALNKYGRLGFSWFILERCNNKQELDNAESFFIELFRTRERTLGYNLKTGGSFGKLADSTKKKLSKAHKGKPMPEGFKETISKIVSGKGNPMYGKKHSDNTKQKIAKKALGRKASEETRKKISEAGKGKKRSDEAKLKYSKSKLEGNNVLSKKVRNIETGEIFVCIQKAKRDLNIDHSSISRCCKGKQNTAGGYHWEYVNE